MENKDFDTLKKTLQSTMNVEDFKDWARKAYPNMTIDDNSALHISLGCFAEAAILSMIKLVKDSVGDSSTEGNIKLLSDLLTAITSYMAISETIIKELGKEDGTTESK